MFGKFFLDKVKEIVTKNHDECLYKFQWNRYAKQTVSYSEEAPNDVMYFFLRPEFIEEAEIYRNVSKSVRKEMRKRKRTEDDKRPSKRVSI